MCDPITAGLAALGGAAALFGGSKDAPAPPPPVVPVAPDLGLARTPGADVKVGDGAAAATNSPTPAYDGFTAKRTTAQSLGGLGRGSGLGL